MLTFLDISCPFSLTSTVSLPFSLMVRTVLSRPFTYWVDWDVDLKFPPPPDILLKLNLLFFLCADTHTLHSKYGRLKGKIIKNLILHDLITNLLRLLYLIFLTLVTNKFSNLWNYNTLYAKIWMDSTNLNELMVPKPPMPPIPKPPRLGKPPIPIGRIIPMPIPKPSSSPNGSLKIICVYLCRINHTGDSMTPKARAAWYIGFNCDFRLWLWKI